MKFFLGLLISFILNSSGIASAKMQQEHFILLGELIKEEGIYQLTDSDYSIDISLNGMGGYLDLAVKKSKKNSILLKNVSDITGAVWLEPNTLIISASPLYGKPGLFKFSADKKHLSHLVKPLPILIDNKNYPDGKSFFELQRVDLKSHEIYYYYTDDLDKIDFNDFRSPKYIRCIVVDGSKCEVVKN